MLLREKAPELYDLWLRIAQDKAETDNYVHRAPYEVPERLAHSGRPRALGAMIVVLAFCGYQPRWAARECTSAGCSRSSTC